MEKRLHILIRSWDVNGLGTSEDQSIVAVLELRNMLVHDLVDAVCEFLFLGDDSGMSGASHFKLGSDRTLTRTVGPLSDGELLPRPC